jgi:uncharacterized protein YndB with AHSA1/START domain
MSRVIIVRSTINTPIEKAWRFYTEPKHITQWNNASNDWHTPYAVNDFKVGGKFLYRMEARDGSAGFDFNGKYTGIRKHRLIAYLIEGGRKVRITFSNQDGKTSINVYFEAEKENSNRMQRQGWQAILDNFKKYTESN